MPLAITDTAAALQTGLIEAIPVPPLSALFFNWYKSTPYMLDIGLAPLVGATIVTKRAWNDISEPDRAAVQAVAANAEKRLRAEVPQQDALAVAEMQKRGLKVIKADLSGKDNEWRAAAEAFASTMRASFVPAEILDAAVRERNAFRQRRSASARDLDTM